MSEIWPARDVEGILREEGAKEERLPSGGFGFVTRGAPVTPKGAGNLEIHGSTQVFIGLEWKSLLGVIYENVAAFRRRETMRVAHGRPKEGDAEVRSILQHHMEEALAEISALGLRPAWPRQTAEMKSLFHVGKGNVWMDVSVNVRIKDR